MQRIECEHAGKQDGKAGRNGQDKNMEQKTIRDRNAPSISRGRLVSRLPLSSVLFHISVPPSIFPVVAVDVRG